MLQLFEKLTFIKAQICGFFNRLDKDQLILSDEIQNQYASLVAAYSRQINVSLKEYPSIEERNTKIQAKAILKYAYDYLHLLLELTKRIEKQSIMDLEIQSLIIKYSDEKVKLIESVYYDQAENEIKIFYDPKIREALERDLSKRINQRYN
jgi:hypothetical protein